MNIEKNGGAENQTASKALDVSETDGFEQLTTLLTSSRVDPVSDRIDSVRFVLCCAVKPFLQVLAWLAIKCFF